MLIVLKQAERYMYILQNTAARYMYVNCTKPTNEITPLHG
mgnify:CR=1 FL=1